MAAYNSLRLKNKEYITMIFRVQWEPTVSYRLKNKGYTLVSSPPPGSGVITNAIGMITISFHCIRRAKINIRIYFLM